MGKTVRRIWISLMCMTVLVTAFAYSANAQSSENKFASIVKEEEAQLQSILEATVTAASQSYTGTALTPAVTVKLGDNTLTEGTDYTVSYSDNINAGTARITVSGIGLYTGTVEKTFVIKAKSLAKATVSSISAKAYTGNYIKPSVTVKLGGKTLVKGTDYTVSYKNNKSIGTASVTIKGKGNYSGSIVKKFKINPKAVKISSLTGGNLSSITVKWTKSPKVTGYQILYTVGSTEKKITVKGVDTLSKKISGISHGKKYSLKVRAYAVVGGVRYYSSYSAAKTITLTAYKGFTNIDGYLYYFKNGLPVKNTSINGLKFGSSGRYTSGNTSLDKTVASIIKSKTRASMTKRQKLKALNDYLVNNYDYATRLYVNVGAKGWENEYAVNMFKDKAGNCYSWAAAFTCLARGLGYKAVAVSGYCTSYLEWGWSRHGFTEIMVDGKAYICDPELEHAYGRDLFFKTAENQYIHYTHNA